jgi:hypothetical protein
MSWLFSQALVAEYSADTSLDGALCALWSGMHMPRASWLPAKTTAACRLSRSGMTFKPLTDAHGADVLTSFLAGFPARTSVAPEKGLASTAKPPACGGTWRELLVKFDRASCSWKTHQCLWEEDLPESSLTLPRWGSMHDGELWERSTPALPTSGNESGSWATPTTMDKLPPKSAKALHKEATLARPGRTKPANLRDQVSNAHMWPTPCASEARQGLQIRREGKKGSQQSLSTAVLFATPQARDFRTGQASRWENPERTRNLNDQIGGQLNPNWVEWLMGWPIGWTDCGASAMGRFRQWCASHGIPCQTDNKKNSL